ncbi:hypothetical protein CTheo_8966 [Ceratobasidium theobromae]|uniref:Uncharacterized protein n=1 Tax=Ceratobasidium theobromae TaxID=1582974 RepID=A0A5N5Q764_9AGAM|nr:hypothetical protein CTheo_8966 [Ceratobasidium theobromae]
MQKLMIVVLRLNLNLTISGAIAAKRLKLSENNNKPSGSGSAPVDRAPYQLRPRPFPPALFSTAPSKFMASLMAAPGPHNVEPLTPTTDTVDANTVSVSSPTPIVQPSSPARTVLDMDDLDAATASFSENLHIGDAIGASNNRDEGGPGPQTMAHRLEAENHHQPTDAFDNPFSGHYCL